jgi:hypothetical protein
VKSHCDEFEDGVLGVLGEKGILFKDVASTRLGRVVINQIPQHNSIAILTELIRNQKSSSDQPLCDL